MPLLISSRVTILCAETFSPSSVIALIRQFLFSGVALVNSSRTFTSHRFMISIISDIESVNYGRGVGYEIIEHIPPDDIKEVSATKIREGLREDGKL